MYTPDLIDSLPAGKVKYTYNIVERKNAQLFLISVSGKILSVQVRNVGEEPVDVPYTEICESGVRCVRLGDDVVASLIYILTSEK